MFPPQSATGGGRLGGRAAWGRGLPPVDSSADGAHWGGEGAAGARGAA